MDIKQNVEDALKWEPALYNSEIGVEVKDGVVTLTGVVDSYEKKLHAEDTAKNVSGVRAVVEKIEIKFNATGDQTDTQIAESVVNALSKNWETRDNKIKVKVENGQVTLEGEVLWNYQKEAIKDTVFKLQGVRSVVNSIQVKPITHDEIEKRDIESALIRNWAIDQDDIGVEVAGNSVTLTGRVESIYQKDEAERIAWNAPGVWMVDNEILVGEVD